MGGDLAECITLLRIGIGGIGWDHGDLARAGELVERYSVPPSAPAPCWAAKACPFCGWVPSIQTVSGGVRIGCNYARCAASPAVAATTRRSALRQWNRRSALAALSAPSLETDDAR